ncbi:MAG: cation transporter [Ruminococcaceae bacterium]|nr:cation transporter [Oscillospiraceae bacterium]
MDNENVKTAGLDVSRDKTIVRTSIVGIVANVFLAAFKAAIGLLSNSIAVVLDAVNNISDAASSVITIVGTKLALKAPDRKHPFGHGRVEYLTAMIISVIVLYAGVTSLTESIKKIIHPETPEYSWVSILIIAVAVVVKIVLGRYVKSVGKRVNSSSLVNSGEDATLDSVISASTLVAALVYIKFGISLEAWLGAIISIIIIKSGVDMIREAISSILGERADAETAKAIKETVCSFDNVFGAYDLVLNDYGPDRFLGSVHIEVPDTLSANEVDELLRVITEKVFKEHNVILTAISVYSVNMTDESIISTREKIEKIVLENEFALQMHGFYLSEEKKLIRFDVVVSFDAPDRNEVYSSVCNEVKKEFPDYELQVVLDTDFSES